MAEKYLLDVGCYGSFGVKVQSLDALNVFLLLLALYTQVGMGRGEKGMITAPEVDQSGSVEETVLLPGPRIRVAAATVFSSPPDLALKKKKKNVSLVSQTFRHSVQSAVRFNKEQANRGSLLYLVHRGFNHGVDFDRCVSNKQIYR